MTRPLAYALALTLCPTAALAQSAARFADPPTAVPAPPAPAPAPALPAAAPAPAPVAPPAPAPVAPPGMRLAASEAPSLMPPPRFGFGYGAPPPVPADGATEPPAAGTSTAVVVGALMLGIPYATGVGVGAAESFENGSGWLVLPAAGPWLALTARRDPCVGLDDRSPQDPNVDSELGRCMTEPLIRGLLVLDGVLQATGAVIMIAGASSGTKKDSPPARGFAVAPTPLGRDGYGVGAVGRF